MATAAEARSAISDSFEVYISQLAKAGRVWEQKPAGGAEGEEAWSARQVAEHIAGAGPFFGAGIAQAIGVTPPPLARVEFPDFTKAVAETTRLHGLFMAVADQLTDAQVDQEVDLPRLGKQTLGGILAMVSGHLQDHASQIKTLCGE